MSPDEEKQQRGLTRERLVEAALGLINEEGLDGLSMRALADRLKVKAASLYWHVRDRRELLELLAESILDGVGHPRERPSWRDTVTALAEAVRRRVSAQKDADRILLEVPDAVQRSDPFAAIKTHLVAAGLQAVEASDIALMVMTYVISGPAGGEVEDLRPAGEVASLAIDSGSRGVILRAGGQDMQTLVRVPHEQPAAAPAVVRGEEVVVRRLRGVGRGVIELTPRRPWRFKVQAPTWNTVLDVGGLEVKEIRVDSGATNLEFFLPPPRGVVPIHVSSGVVNISIHRPRAAAVVARAHTGAVKLKFDEFSTKVAVFDVHWRSGEDAARAADRYELEISGGVVDLKLDTYTAKAAPVGVGAPPPEPHPAGKPGSALEILLDGVEARVKGRPA